MKNIKSLLATLGLAALALFGTSGCAGPQYAEARGESIAPAASPDQYISDAFGRTDYISLSSTKAWPASASYHNQ